MAHPFEIRKEIDVAASPEEVWEAIATGEGIDGWFLGTGNRVEPREGGAAWISFGGDAGSASRVTSWDPPRRFAHQGEPAPDGTMHAFVYEIEARAGGTTRVRLVHSGFLADDWESEYDAVNEGDFMYLHLMAQYATHFRGRKATVVSIWRPDEPNRERALAAFRTALGLGDTVRQGDPVDVDAEGIGRISGQVDFVSRGIVGVRTKDALLRFLHSPQNIAYLGHHIYRDDRDPEATRQAWQAWLDRAFI
jgi:uncharacterized protein YndB with AHSA1/START domain